MTEVESSHPWWTDSRTGRTRNISISPPQGRYRRGVLCFFGVWDLDGFIVDPDLSVSGSSPSEAPALFLVGPRLIFSFQSEIHCPKSIVAGST